MSLYATEVVPQPVIVDGVVDVDSDSRTLAVRLSEREQGGNRRLWRDAFEGLKSSRESGYLSGPPTLYASTPGATNVAHAQPGDWGMLLFRFPKGEASFVELISKPGLVARVAMDRNSRHFISVNFKHAGP